MCSYFSLHTVEEPPMAANYRSLSVTFVHRLQSQAEKLQSGQYGKDLWTISYTRDKLSHHPAPCHKSASQSVCGNLAESTPRFGRAFNDRISRSINHKFELDQQ